MEILCAPGVPEYPKKVLSAPLPALLDDLRGDHGWGCADRSACRDSSETVSCPAHPEGSRCSCRFWVMQRAGREIRSLQFRWVVMASRGRVFSKSGEQEYGEPHLTELCSVFVLLPKWGMHHSIVP